MDRSAMYLTERYSVTLAQAQYLMTEMRNAGLGLSEAELILQSLAAWNGAGNSAMMQDALLGVLQSTDATQTPPFDGERHDKWQYIAAYGYWVYMVSYDNWQDCAARCEDLCQRYDIGVWVDGARGDYRPAANVSNTDAIRAIDAAPKQGEV